jgi:phosphoglycerate dehydrogenase-like enzyme
MRIVLSVRPPVRALLFSAESVRRLESLGELVILDDPGDADALLEVLGEAEVLVTSWGAVPLTEEVLAKASRLRLVAHSASSVKYFVTDAMFERGIRLTQAGQGMAQPVAEVSLAFTLVMLNRIHRFDHGMRSGAPWPVTGDPTDQHGIAGSRIGVVGASRTGIEYIGMARALGAEIVVYDPYLTDERATELGVLSVGLDELMRTSRVVALHAPVLPETHELIGRKELALMPDGAALVNTARSWLVDSAALLDELRSGRIDAALDVYDTEPLPLDDPLRSLPNVLLTPHRAAATVEGYLALGEIVADEVERHAAGEPLQHEVLQPDLARMG